MALLLFKALGDETRLRLINILLHYELSVNELVQILAMGQSRVSRHLKILTEAGLLKSRRDGLWVFYSTPATGPEFDFLNAMAPFIPVNTLLADDLTRAAQTLEERIKKTRQFFNAIAENWDDLNQEILAGFPLTEYVIKEMPKKCNVAVDLGCGTGAVLARMHQHANLVIGVDGSAKMLDLCRARLSKESIASTDISLRIGELSHLPLADHEADFASINLVLHHLPRPDKIFTEISRILTPSGRLLITDFLQHNDETMRTRYGDHWLGFDLPTLSQTVRESGFDIVKTDNFAVGNGLTLFSITAQSNI